MLTGVAVGAAFPQRFWLGALGLLVGQLLVFGFHALLPPQELWVLGLAALLVYGVWGLAGTGVGAVAAILAHRREPRGVMAPVPEAPHSATLLPAQPGPP